MIVTATKDVTLLSDTTVLHVPSAPLSIFLRNMLLK
jgi:hypothetical protein